MSDDESFTLFVVAAITLLGIVRIALPLIRYRDFCSRGASTVIAMTALASFVGLFLILRNFSAKDVRNDPAYLLLFMLMGAAVETLVLLLSPVLGISWRDDALERHNDAALSVIVGAIIGSMLIFAAGNIGEGDTIWSTVGPALLALVLWGFLWALLEALSHVSEAVTVERDPASGLRLADLLIANGLVLGRAIAGGWISLDECVSTLLKIGWPVLPLTFAAILMQRRGSPATDLQHPSPITATLPGAALIVLAAAWVLLQGRW